jgi:hypothetical protein
VTAHPPLRPELLPAYDALRARGSVSLDEVADAMDVVRASAADVEALLDALEAGGVEVRSPEPVDLPAELAKVLGAARALGAELGRRATIDEIGARAGLDATAVRRALLYARVLSR